MALRDKHIEFIEDIKKQTGLSLSALAAKAGVSNSTLTRFVRMDDYKQLNAGTLDSLAKAGGFESYEDYLLKKNASSAGADGTRINIDFNDVEKFEIYEQVRNMARHFVTPPSEYSRITNEVVDSAKMLNTKFINDSFIMYVFEKMGFETK